ncbi:acyl-[acyl-carrier-protein] thioesterase [Rhodospira trueperi]|uniref:Acyl-ACP thioesterase n=1 Tax=Rhodospira trueperi TaxID=69960 RepID=A0A1G7CRP7_9PROT|nr:acyl-ACP thioesterase domain-containing protein [Rhodospira trueperi]SDE42022.1 Acyl-ACP thioesterase [Rhodospira trueperi]
MLDRPLSPDWSAVAAAASPAMASRLSLSVRVREAGPDGRMTLHALADVCQEAAAVNAAGFGHGLTETMGRGAVWVLNRARFAVRRSPRLGETVTVETWPAGLDRRGAVRVYRVGVEGDGVVAAVVTVWSLFDLGARRPVTDPATVLRGLPEPGPRLLPTPVMPPPAPDAGPSCAVYPVHASQIDVYGHVNHTHLIAWSLGENGDAVSAPFCPREVLIGFRGECRPGDRVGVRRLLGADGLAWSSLVTEADTREIVRAAAWYGDEPATAET